MQNEIELVVDRQLDAYNKGDYEVFAACYHEDIGSYNLENSAFIPEMSGANFFTHYRNKFLENPQIHCEVTQRIVHDTLVVDKELISDYRNQRHKELVIYQVEGGKISKMWFSKVLPERSEVVFHEGDHTSRDHFDS